LQQSGEDELHRAALAANALVDVYAEAVSRLLAETHTDGGAVAAIGAHGQTVRHRPGQGYTWQINNPARLAEAARIAVVADFRSRDIAAGGQGAPLVPAFHAALFQRPQAHRAVVNIGGMANVTNLPHGADGEGVTGWDTGPGNVLLDAWCERHRQEPYDHDGRWAASGRADPALLSALAEEPYFAASPPKSTGRDLFDLAWLDARLPADLRPEDVQATLLALTADTIARDIARYASGATEVIVCGGGARNSALMARLQTALDGLPRPTGRAPPAVMRSDGAGIAANHVEALAFAWLARQALTGGPGNLPAVTGARGKRILGAIYPA
jgi:anhydro-N-acetylmuramic acid kinase